MNFPPDFLWGSASCALQIEGALTEDGRVPSVRDDNEAEPACDHYHRWAEDVDWLARMGHSAYRFSIAWPRVQKRSGLDFYDRLVDALCEKGIRPVATLIQGDLPAYLGSWTDAVAVERFREYADWCGERLGDRVSHWLTVHDPAADLRSATDWKSGFELAHRQLQAHHEAVAALRPHARGQIGLALLLSPVKPANSSRAARRAARLADGYSNRWFLQAAVDGTYPSELASLLRRTLGWEGAFEQPQPLDFLGVSYAGELQVADLPTEGSRLRSADALDRLLLDLHRRYPGLPLVLMQSSAAPSDANPTMILESELDSVVSALQQGIPVRGHFYWSLLDGYNPYQRVWQETGLLHVDRETLQRSPRPTAELYSQRMRT